MTDRITLTLDLQDFPAHKKLRDAVLHPEVEKFLKALTDSDYRVVDASDCEVAAPELLRLATGVSHPDLNRERDKVVMAAQAAFRALCEPTK